MRANRVYRLLVRREGVVPSWLAGPDRMDHIEVVDIDSGEVVLYWDCPAPRCRQLVRALRADLVQRDAEDFFDTWRAYEP
jgi:hypothetical protein